MEPYADVVTAYERFAGAVADESACFARWATAVAGDHELCRWIGRLPPVKQQPNLVFAAARWHGVAAPGPYEGLRSALLEDTGAITSTILARSTQTNEVGRLATLVPVFARAVPAGPVALLEAGASAGLCLYPDRYDYDWGPAGSLRGSGGPTLTCAPVGPLPVPSRPVDIAWRGGIDLNPLSVDDPDATAWLLGLVWPEQDERRARLRAAIDIAAADPPRIVRGDLLDGLPALVEEAAEHGTVIVFHSAVIAYLEPPDRDRFRSMMTDLVGRGRCRWVSNEGANVLPGLTPTGSGPEGPMEFVEALDGRAVAWTHGHGRTMRWLGG